VWLDPGDADDALVWNENVAEFSSESVLAFDDVAIEDNASAVACTNDMSKPGVSASVRCLFAFLEVNERYRDLSTLSRTASFGHVRPHRPAASPTAVACAAVRSGAEQRALGSQQHFAKWPTAV
jgi:hypothetical protein